MSFLQTDIFLSSFSRH